MPRLFVAVDLPDEVTEQVERLCIGLPAIRWVEPEQLHLTVRFIGEVEPPVFYELGQALSELSLRPFELRLKGLGIFPPRGAPQTLWVGVEEDGGLTQLRRRVDRAADEAGVPPERRKFQPHVTLGRFREPPPQQRLASFIAGRALFRSEPFMVSGFSLYSSILRPEGALHVREAAYDFVSGVMERA
ncbi:MAG TPA: RNA 2',3'-cyclic phosphodiesterase [Geminicoccaceae bacterium]|nr:RNA 2',3'-cyclic phosphodiesterase [Geminicoccus sp.]HMU49550.1 RNA 2',3'-cyclic phosphodiesterase [Geminicoccaceae bacterium]